MTYKAWRERRIEAAESREDLFDFPGDAACEDCGSSFATAPGWECDQKGCSGRFLPEAARIYIAAIAQIRAAQAEVEAHRDIIGAVIAASSDARGILTKMLVEDKFPTLDAREEEREG